MLVLLMATLYSCSSYPITGKKYLDAGFNGRWEAKDYLSDDLSREDEQLLKEYISELKQEFGDSSYEFHFRAGYRFRGWFGEIFAFGFYSFNDDRQNIVYVEFEKENGKWCVDDIGLDYPDDLINEYSICQKDYAQAKESGDNDKIKESRQDLKDTEKVIYAFRDFFNDEEWESFINPK